MFKKIFLLIVFSLILLSVVSAAGDLPPIKTGEFYNSGFLTPGIGYCAPGNNEVWSITYVGEKIDGQDFWHDRRSGDNKYWQLPLGLSMDVDSMQGQLFAMFHHRQTSQKVPCSKYQPGRRPSHYMIKVHVYNPCNPEGVDHVYYIDLIEGDYCKSKPDSVTINFDEENHEVKPYVKVDGWHGEDDFAVSTVIDAEGNPTLAFKDKLGNLVKVVDANGETWNYEYNANNKLACIEMPGRTGTCWDDYKLKVNRDADGFIKSEYDPLGRVTWTYHPDDGVKEFFYDKAGNPVLVVQKNDSTPNAVVRGCYLSGYDVSSRVLWTAFDSDNHGAKDCFEYYTNKDNCPYSGSCSPDDKIENILQLQPYRHMNDEVDNYASHESGSVYDPYSFKAYQFTEENSEVLADDSLLDVSPYIRSVNYYDGNDDGFPCLDDADDGLSVGAGKEFAVGKLCGVETFNDDNSLLSKREFGYDKKGRLVAERITLVSPRNSEEYVFLITYKYDFAGDLIKKKVSDVSNRDHDDKLIMDPFWIEYSYDSAKRLSKISACDNYGCQEVVHDIKYDAAGNILSYEQGDNQIDVNYYYDARDRLVRMQYDQPSDGGLAKVLFDRSYSYNKINNLVRMQEPSTGRAASFVYDPLSRLKEVNNENNPYYENEWSYSYDPLGNRLMMIDNNGETSYSYDVKSNRLLKVSDNNGTQDYTYDEWGNVIAVNDDKFFYDENNMMIKSVVNGVSAEYYYDGVNHRLFKEESDKETIYLRDSSGSLIADFIIEYGGSSSNTQTTPQQEDDTGSEPADSAEDQGSQYDTSSSDKILRNANTATQPSGGIFNKNSFTANVIRAADNGNFFAKILAWFFKLFRINIEKPANIHGLAVSSPPANYDYSSGLRTAYINLGLKQVARINLPVINESSGEASQVVEDSSTSSNNPDSVSQDTPSETTTQTPTDTQTNSGTTNDATVDSSSSDQDTPSETTTQTQTTKRKWFDFLR